MTSARSVCMSVSRASGAGLCGVGSIALSGGKGRTRETKDQESGSKFIKVCGKSRKYRTLLILCTNQNKGFYNQDKDMFRSMSS